MTTTTLERLDSETMTKGDELALLGGPQTVPHVDAKMFHWPIVTDEDEAAILAVVRAGTMSGIDITKHLEAEFAAWQGTKYALAWCNGTMALQAAMFGCGIGQGDEIICPSITYWASALPAFSLGATVVFADIDEKTLCLDPQDIERHISEKTKAIVVVHYLGHPCAMDEIIEIARRHNLKVIEDVSHAQGGLYRGRKLGTFGDVAAMSMMSGKSLAIGEGGMLATDNAEIHDRAIAWGHYERYNKNAVATESLKPYAGLPLGGVKGRLNQTASAMGRVQLKYYDERCAEIRRSLNYFWDLLEGVPGLRAHRVDENSGSNMAGWYAAHGLYVPAELGGLSVARFAQAVSAEGVSCSPGCNFALHRHPLFNDCDIYHAGKPTRIAHSERDVRQPAGTLPVSERINNFAFSIPWFKHYQPEIIEAHAAAYRKVAENYAALLRDDETSGVTGGAGLSRRD